MMCYVVVMLCYYNIISVSCGVSFVAEFQPFQYTVKFPRAKFDSVSVQMEPSAYTALIEHRGLRTEAKFILLNSHQL